MSRGCKTPIGGPGPRENCDVLLWRAGLCGILPEAYLEVVGVDSREGSQRWGSGRCRHPSDVYHAPASCWLDLSLQRWGCPISAKTRVPHHSLETCD